MCKGWVRRRHEDERWRTRVEWRQSETWQWEMVESLGSPDDGQSSPMVDGRTMAGIQVVDGPKSKADHHVRDWQEHASSS